MAVPRAPEKEVPIPSRWRFGGFEFDGRTGEIRRRGRSSFAPAQPAAVLCALLETPGELGERETLVSRLWHGHRLVDAEHGLNAAVSRLRALLGDHPNRPRYVETIPGRGYRLAAGCEVAGAYASLVVLPFADFGDAGGRSLADELGEELTSALSGRLPQRVVSWLSASTYRGVRRLLPEVARELDVDVALLGAVLCGDSGAHVSVDLLDARADAHLWAGSYEATASDGARSIVDLAGRVARGVASALNGDPCPDAERSPAGATTSGPSPRAVRHASATATRHDGLGLA